MKEIVIAAPASSITMRNSALKRCRTISLAGGFHYEIYLFFELVLFIFYGIKYFNLK
jgi:hypothetical protein